MESTIETLYKSIQHLDHCVQLSPPFPLTHNPPQSPKELEKTKPPRMIKPMKQIPPSGEKDAQG